MKQGFGWIFLCSLNFVKIIFCSIFFYVNVYLMKWNIFGIYVFDLIVCVLYFWVKICRHGEGSSCCTSSEAQWMYLCHPSVTSLPKQDLTTLARAMRQLPNILNWVPEAELLWTFLHDWAICCTDCPETYYHCKMLYILLFWSDNGFFTKVFILKYA